MLNDNNPEERPIRVRMLSAEELERHRREWPKKEAELQEWKKEHGVLDRNFFDSVVETDLDYIYDILLEFQHSQSARFSDYVVDKPEKYRGSWRIEIYFSPLSNFGRVGVISVLIVNKDRARVKVFCYGELLPFMEKKEGLLQYRRSVEFLEALGFHLSNLFQIKQVVETKASNEVSAKVTRGPSQSTIERVALALFLYERGEFSSLSSAAKKARTTTGAIEHRRDHPKVKKLLSEMRNDSNLVSKIRSRIANK